MNGKGIFNWADGRKYEGDYHNDRKHGHGKFTWSDGRIYDGAWYNGKQHGQGTFMYIRDNKLHERVGVWENGKRIRWV